MEYNELSPQQSSWVEHILARWHSEVKSRLWHVAPEILTHDGPASLAAQSTLTSFSIWLNELLEVQNAADHSEQSPPTINKKRLHKDTIAADRNDHNELMHAVPLRNKPFIPEDIKPIAQFWVDLPVVWADLRLMWNLLYAAMQGAEKEHGTLHPNLDMTENWLNNLTLTAADLRVEHLEHQLAMHGEESLFNQHLAGRFLSNASHEIRTPLTAVLGFAELLIEDTYGPMTEDQKTAVGHIENSAQNLLEIINNLLDLLHIRAGKLELRYRTLDASLLLGDIYKILLPLAHRKQVDFTIELSDDLGHIETDENIFRHTVYHLLASTLRATPSQGKVHLSASRSSEKMQIITHDTALHLPHEALLNMTEPFPLIENSPTRGYEGWEVGLPLVLRYLEIQNGTMDIKSQPEGGTHFYISLPLVRPQVKNENGARDGMH